MMKDYQENLWEKVLLTLQRNISEQGYKTWFNETKVLEQNDDNFLIKVPTQFIADYLNKNYREMVSEICYNLFNKKYEIIFHFWR